MTLSYVFICFFVIIIRINSIMFYAFKRKHKKIYESREESTSTKMLRAYTILRTPAMRTAQKWKRRDHTNRRWAFTLCYAMLFYAEWESVAHDIHHPCTPHRKWWEREIPFQNTQKVHAKWKIIGKILLKCNEKDENGVWKIELRDRDHREKGFSEKVWIRTGITICFEKF